MCRRAMEPPMRSSHVRPQVGHIRRWCCILDAFGIRPALEAHAQRLAGHGYLVLVPNVFYRDGRSPVAENITELMQAEDRQALFAVLRPKMDALTPAALTADSKGWLAYLRAHPEAHRGVIGTVGYCLGGRLSLRMAGEFPKAVAAAASFHGGNLATGDDSSPHLAAVRATGELYIGHADNDGSMPPEQMGTLTAALSEAHVRHTAELYVEHSTVGRRPTPEHTTSCPRSATGCACWSCSGACYSRQADVGDLHLRSTRAARLSGGVSGGWVR